MKIGNHVNEQFTLTRKGIGRSHGTFGEFLQGVLPNDKDFLITFPIKQFSESEFVTLPEKDELIVYPSNKLKSRQLAIKILKFFDKPLGGYLKLTSDLQQGKGLASSTADMIATSRAIEDCFDVNIPVILLEQFIREIEPSDGIMYPGVVVYYQKEVRLGQCIGNCPSLTVLALDEIGEVDTINFNQIDKPFNYTDKLEYQELLNKAILAFKNNNLKLLGEVTTKSAILNQKLLHKKTLDTMLRICRKINGLGIVTAHSGAYMGILISNTDPSYLQKIEVGTQQIKQLGYPVQLFQSL